MRVGGLDGMQKAVTTGDWTDPCFVEAGEHFKELVDLQPFQKGFLRRRDGAGRAAAAMGNGKAPWS